MNTLVLRQQRLISCILVILMLTLLIPSINNAALGNLGKLIVRAGVTVGALLGLFVDGCEVLENMGGLVTEKTEDEADIIRDEIAKENEIIDKETRLIYLRQQLKALEARHMLYGEIIRNWNSQKEEEYSDIGGKRHFERLQDKNNEAQLETRGKISTIEKEIETCEGERKRLRIKRVEIRGEIESLEEAVKRQEKEVQRLWEALEKARENLRWLQKQEREARQRRLI